MRSTVVLALGCPRGRLKPLFCATRHAVRCTEAENIFFYTANYTNDGWVKSPDGKRGYDAFINSIAFTFERYDMTGPEKCEENTLTKKKKSSAQGG